MAAAAFVVGFVVFGVLYSFGIFLEPMMQGLDASRSATSALFALSSSAFYFLGPLTGSLGDRLGPRVMALVGAVLMAAGLVATAFAPSIWIALITYGLGVGIGAASAYIPTFAVLGGWFERSRTRALSIAVAGTGGGMLVLPPFAAVLVESVGWRWAMIALGLVAGGLLLASGAFIRPSPRGREAPAERLDQVLRSQPFVLMYASWVFGTMALLVALVFLPAFAVSGGADPVAASWLVSIVGGASIIGRLGIGYVTSTSGTLRLYKLSILGMAASYVIWLVLPSYGWLVVFATVFGVAYGVRIALVAPVLIALFGAARLGTLLGTFFTATGIAGLTGPMIASLVMDFSGSQTAAILSVLAMGTLGLLLILPLKPR
jgi:MFS family permease